MSNAKANSCLISKLSHYMDLDESNRRLLRALEHSERSFAANDIVYSGGERTINLFVVKSGWLFSSTTLSDGRRHVVRIYNAGDIIGLPTLAFSHHVLDLEAATACCLCPFSKQDLDQILERSPRLTALLFSLTSREEVVLIDTLRAASRMAPIARVAYFLLDLASRLRVTNSGMTNRFRMPLTQTVIGDTIGLTNVTVSRALTAMQESGLIDRCGQDVVLLNEAELRKLCDFSDRYAEMDISWFPGS